MSYQITTKKVMYGIAMSVLAGMVLFFLPVWSIGAIEVKGTSVYSAEDVINASQIKTKSHILTVRKEQAVEELKKLPYVAEAEIVTAFPNKLTIEVTEHKPIGYVKFVGAYLCLGEKGQVLEQVSQPYLKLPIIEGLKFTKFRLGEVLPLENEDNFLVVVEMMNTLKKHEYDTKINSMDVSNLEQIHLYVDKLDVIIGNIRDFDKKVGWLAQIHEKYPMGVLDLSYVVNGQAILTPLT
ncbi:MAG: cell division protein FtsQ/DivIB [Cellulosilyticaceae bacterium]